MDPRTVDLRINCQFEPIWLRGKTHPRLACSPEASSIVPESVFSFVKQSLHQFCIEIGRDYITQTRVDQYSDYINSMPMALLRAPIYLLAHGQFYDACGPNESITNERSALRAFRSTRNCWKRAPESVSKSMSKSALNMDPGAILA